MRDLEDKSKLISQEFEDFGDHTKKLIREASINDQIYMFGIYITLISKIILLKIINDKKFQNRKEEINKRIDYKFIMTDKLSIIIQIKYFCDNLFLYDKVLHELFFHIFVRYKDKYLRYTF
jgi:hypothetical protein